MSGVHSLLHLPVCAGGAGALLQPGHLLPVHQSEGGNSSSPQHVTVSRIICNITPLIAAEDDIQYDADEPTRRRASGDSLWDSSRLLGFCKVDVQIWRDLLITWWSYFRSGWDMGSAMCQATGFLLTFLGIAAIFNLTAISLFRYYVITWREVTENQK